MQEKISVFATVTAAVQGVFRNLGELASKAAVPFAVSTLLLLIWVELFYGDEVLSVAVQWLLLLRGLPHAWFALACHRVCLEELEIGCADTGRTSVFEFLLWSTIASALIMLPELLVPGGVGGLVDFLSFFGAVSVSVRYCLILPAIAAGERANLSTASKRSSGNAWRLFWMFALVYSLAFIPMMIFVFVSAPFPLPEEPLLQTETSAHFGLMILYQLAEYFGLALGAFGVCHAFAQLRSKAAPSAE